MIDPMEFIKYDKVTDDVFILGPNVVLRFNVSLSKITPEGKRYHFYKEFEYPSKAHDGSTLVVIKRSYDYYLSIENVQKDRSGDKVFIRIGTQDFYRFKCQIDKAVSWFTDPQYQGLYVKSHGKLTLTGNIPESLVGGYPQGKFIRIVPTVIDKGEGKDRLEQGVEVDLSDYENYVLINLDKLFNLQFFLSTFNMYMAGQNLVNYLGSYSGVNRFSIADSGSTGKVFRVDTSSPTVEGINDRKIGSKKNISSLE